MRKIIYSTVNTLRDKYTPVTHTSTFRKTGQITPEEFVAAGDYLVFKFPTWSWADADPESKRAPHLPPGKQFLVTRNVPCHRRLDENFAGDAAHEEALVNDGDGFKNDKADGDDDGWLRTGGLASSQPLKAREVRVVDDAGNVGEREPLEDDEIPDMEEEDDDDEAIIRDVDGNGRSRYVLAAHLRRSTQKLANRASRPPSQNLHVVHNVLASLPHPSPLYVRLPP